MAATDLPLRDDPLTARSVLATARTWFGFLILGILVATTISLAVSVLRPADYVAGATLLLTPAPRQGGTTFADLQLAQALAPTYAEFATTTPLLERVIAATGADTNPTRLTQAITTRVPIGTSLIDLSVADQNPATAAALANGIAAELSKNPPQAGAGTPPFEVTLSVIDPATPPSVRSGLGLVASAVLAGVIGLFVSISIALVVEGFRRDRP